VFYSVLMTSGPEALSDVTVTATLPEGATFVKDFWKPETATFVGEQDGVLTWTLDSLDPEVAAGPFTFVASFADAESEEFAPPASFKAAVTSNEGAVENEVVEDTIASLETEGLLEVTPDGMIDFEAVEETGIWFYAGADAVTAPVTLSFLRNAINEEAALPEVAEDTWWCGFVSITADETVSFAQPILMVVPLLRASTPNTVMPVFAQQAGGDWELISAEDTVSSVYAEGAETASAFAKVAPSGTEAYVLLNAAEFSSETMNFAIGVNTSIRTVSIQPVAPTVVNVTPPINSISDPAPWF
jgi:hypothetical protein